MQRIKSPWLGLIIIFLLSSQESWSLDVSKKETLISIQALINNNLKQINIVADKLDQSFKAQSNLDLSRLDADKERFSKHVNSLIKLRSEYLLRQDFYDRIKLQVEKYYHGKSLGRLLINRLEVLYNIELKNPHMNQGMWQFMHYLRTALTRIPERNENPIAFIEGYIKFSSISKPKTPHEFSKSRDYINSYTNERANGVSATDIGLKLEDTLNQLSSDENKINKADIQLKTKIDPKAKLEAALQISEPETVDAYETSSTKEKSPKELTEDTSNLPELKSDTHIEQDFKAELVRIKKETIHKVNSLEDFKKIFGN